jgi:hypothetical protein
VRECHWERAGGILYLSVTTQRATVSVSRRPLRMYQHCTTFPCVWNSSLQYSLIPPSLLYFLCIIGCDTKAPTIRPHSKKVSVSERHQSPKTTLRCALSLTFSIRSLYVLYSAISRGSVACFSTHGHPNSSHLSRRVSATCRSSTGTFAFCLCSPQPAIHGIAYKRGQETHVGIMFRP